GHPPPVLLDAEGRATVLGPSEEAPPLGMSALGPWSCPVDTFPFPPGATLICYTDGVTEARDAAGTFYPLAERVTGWTETDPDAFLRRFRTDLQRYVGGHLG
uniref:PP2C family protein-serine/threonine phosphatase n=1 Tax=Streptomyces sp. CHD11 TaxID=2741325 RepID=UPI0020413E13